MAKKTASQKRRSSGANKKVDAGRLENGQQPLDSMEDEFEVPDEVKKAADRYKTASLNKAKTNTAYTSAHDNLLETMREHEVESVRITMNGQAVNLYIDNTEKIKQRKPKKQAAEA